MWASIHDAAGTRFALAAMRKVTVNSKSFLYHHGKIFSSLAIFLSLWYNGNNYGKEE